ncbi:surface antigen-domain-containing protein [Thamnocephalis sphaerospora]|uniref:Surface antigen-domain-containing protein n=1 Tax=Thamnocephalis sphaerospora TaxID=78915 RepID=A0A4V1IVS9_9FUNG|nr:surface antigen-domain-containing protein [Thamnocephalis sphaerospora]|eukprot:RKP05119.1 surface antigen-domain-containing protein [Thamnocephalis sphaerospora]
MDSAAPHATAASATPKNDQGHQSVFSVIYNARDQPVDVNAVLIHGVNHTRRSFLKYLATPIMEAETLGEMIEGTREAAARMARFEIYTSVAAGLDMARGPLAREGSVDAQLYVKERGRITIKTGTEIGDVEGSLNGSFIYRNVFGGAERFEASASFGTRTSASFQTSLSAPIAADPDRIISINGYQTLRDNALYRSHDEMSRGVALRYDTYTSLGQHQLYYDLVWREVRRLGSKASLSVRQDAGHTLKSSIGHALVHDRRELAEVPTSGYVMRLQNELAGFGGDIKFVKSEVEGQRLRRLGRGFSTSLTVRGGLILPLREEERIRVNDRFLLGGPVSLRGFALHGVGPRDKRDAIGGDIYASIGASLFTPLPKVDSERLKGHLFVNAGSLRVVPHEGLRSAKGRDMLRSMYRHASVSAGFGLVYWHSMARFELNFCVPIAASTGDRLHTGLQFGFGLHFL